MIGGLDHLQIAIPPGGEEEGRRFYGAVLGLKEIAKPTSMNAEGAWFALGRIELHLGVDRNFVPAQKAHPGLATDALDAISDRLSEAGFPVKKDARLPGVRRIFTADPFGNRIEILER